MPKFGFGRRRNLGKIAASALTLSRLETRDCPSVTASLVGSTLTITGNGGSDVVTVTQTIQGDLQVKGNNGNFSKIFKGNAVATLKANLGAGFNNLTIDLSTSNGWDADHEGFDQNPVIFVTAGNDSDTVTINLGDADGGGGGGSGDDDGRGDVFVSVNLAGGNDRLFVTAGGDFGGTFTEDVTMGSGNDSVSTVLDGDLDGDAAVSYDLGTGNDTSSFEVGGDVKSNFEFALVGNTGNDSCDVTIGGNISGTSAVSGDLGSGNDTFTFSVAGDVDDVFEYSVDAHRQRLGHVGHRRRSQRRFRWRCQHGFKQRLLLDER